MDEKIVLAVETTANIGGVAVVSSTGGVLAEEILEDGMKHGRLLLPAIDRVLTAASLTLEQLDAIAASIGPGSYTGTRVGVIAAKSLAFAAGIDVVGVSSMAALAYSSKCSSGIVVPMQYARNDEVYTGVYEVEKGRSVRAVLSDLALEPELVVKMAAEYGAVAFIGSGLERFAEEFSELKAGSELFEEDVKAPAATAVGFIGLSRIGEATDPLGVEPVYMRRDSSPCSFEKFQSK